MTDPQTGISIRFVKQFDIAKDQSWVREDTFATAADAALFLAMRDGRDVPMAIKVADAWDYVNTESRFAPGSPLGDTEA